MSRVNLGNSVYASFDGQSVVISLNNDPRNSIYLNQQQIEALGAFSHTVYEVRSTPDIEERVMCLEASVESLSETIKDMLNTLAKVSFQIPRS